MHKGPVADLLRLAEQRSRHLRVEHGMRHAADIVEDDLDVLVPRMEHLRDVLVL